MPSYRLHYFPESGNSYKLALMLTLCGEKFEPVWTDFSGSVTRTPEWRRTVNEMGEIPVLEVDGVKLTQTAPILLKLAEQCGRFGGDTAEEKFELLRWLFWDNHKLTGYMATYRFMRTFIPNGDPHVLKHFRHRIDDFLGILEQHLSRNEFAIGAKPSVADFSMMAHLHYPSDEHGYDFAASHPAILLPERQPAEREQNPADDHDHRDRPGADADAAGNLFGFFIPRDLAIALLVGVAGIRHGSSKIGYRRASAS
ncbi:glutathione S-transferase [Bradyrhizobium sp. F1.4.3]